MSSYLSKVNEGLIKEKHPFLFIVWFCPCLYYLLLPVLYDGLCRRSLEVLLCVLIHSKAEAVPLDKMGFSVNNFVLAQSITRKDSLPMILSQLLN